MNISNSLSWVLNSIQLSHSEYIFLQNIMYPVRFLQGQPVLQNSKGGTGPIPTKSQPPHGILWNKQPGVPGQFLQLYMVHAPQDSLTP